MTTFWRATVHNLATETEQTFIVQAPYDEVRVLEILAEVHPEYETIKLEKIDKPEWINNSWCEVKNGA